MDPKGSKRRKFFQSLEKIAPWNTSTSSGRTKTDPLKTKLVSPPHSDHVARYAPQPQISHDHNPQGSSSTQIATSGTQNNDVADIEPDTAADNALDQNHEMQVSSTLKKTNQDNAPPLSPSVQIQQASDGSNRLGLRSGAPRPDPLRLSVSHRYRGRSVGSAHSSHRNPPSRIIEDWPLNHILPQASDVSLKLTVMYNNQKIMEGSALADCFVWTDPATYGRLITIVNDAQRLIEPTVEKGHTLRLYHGGFRIIAQDHEYSEKFDALTQLEEMTIKGICGFISQHPKQRFDLEYFVKYSSVRTEKNRETEKFRDMVREEVQRLMDGNKNFNNQKFVPRTDRDQLTSEKIISGIVAEESNNDLAKRDALSSEIIKNGATGLFLACITKYVSVNAFVDLFEKCEYRDDTLPKMNENLTEMNNEKYRGLVEHIHAFFARKINDGERHIDLHDHEIMPILNVTDHQGNPKTHLGSGATGSVCKVRVEAGHHDIPGHHQSYFALKTIEDKNRHSFERERANLERLRKQGHPHIVRHITSWCQMGTYYILYPLAAGNLRTYMQEFPPPKVSVASVRWFLRQLCGLASALHHIHEQQEEDEKRKPFTLTLPPSSITRIQPLSSDSPIRPTSKRTGYHHDLKPENILIFERREGVNPVFKISDFGAGKFTDLEEEEQSHEASNLGGTASYFGPEWDGRRSRPFDVWAMACVLTELLIWFLQDAKLGEFHDARVQSSGGDPHFKSDYYWYFDGVKRDVKPVVLTYLSDMERLCTQDNSSGPLPTASLKPLPDTIKSCFKPLPADRLVARALCERLDRMKEEADVAWEIVELSSPVPGTPASRHS